MPAPPVPQPQAEARFIAVRAPDELREPSDRLLRSFLELDSRAVSDPGVDPLNGVAFELQRGGRQLRRRS